MSGGQYAALAYGVVFLFVLVYVAIIAAKLQRLQRETTELVELVRSGARAPSDVGRSATYAAAVPTPGIAEEDRE